MTATGVQVVASEDSLRDGMQWSSKHCAAGHRSPRYARDHRCVLCCAIHRAEKRGLASPDPADYEPGGVAVTPIKPKPQAKAKPKPRRSREDSAKKLTDVRCSLEGCGKRVNVLAAEATPPFCCTECCRLFYGAKRYQRGAGVVRVLFDHEVRPGDVEVGA